MTQCARARYQDKLRLRASPCDGRHRSASPLDPRMEVRALPPEPPCASGAALARARRPVGAPTPWQRNQAGVRRATAVAPIAQAADRAAASARVPLTPHDRARACLAVPPTAAAVNRPPWLRATARLAARLWGAEGPRVAKRLAAAGATASTLGGGPASASVRQKVVAGDRRPRELCGAQHEGDAGDRDGNEYRQTVEAGEGNDCPC